jgi:hypothetical protein
MRIKADRSGNVQEFWHVEAPIAALVLRHVGRRFAEPLGHHGLREAGGFAAVLKQLNTLRHGKFCGDGFWCRSLGNQRRRSIFEQLTRGERR